MNVTSYALRFMAVVFKPKLTFQAIGFQESDLKHWILVVYVRRKHPGGSCCLCLSLVWWEVSGVILEACLVLTELSDKLQRTKAQRSCREATFFLASDTILTAGFCIWYLVQTLLTRPLYLHPQVKLCSIKWSLLSYLHLKSLCFRERGYFFFSPSTTWT